MSYHVLYLLWYWRLLYSDTNGFSSDLFVRVGISTLYVRVRSACSRYAGYGYFVSALSEGKLALIYEIRGINYLTKDINNMLLTIRDSESGTRLPQYNH